MGARLSYTGIENDTREGLVTMSQSVTAYTYYDTGLSRNSSTGATISNMHAVFVLGIYMNLYNSGLGTHYSSMGYSAPFQWNTDGTNSNAECPLAYGTLIGHAPNAWGEGYDRDEGMRLRIKHEYSNANNGWRIQYNFTASGTLSSGSGQTLQFWLRRLA